MVKKKPMSGAWGFTSIWSKRRFSAGFVRARGLSRVFDRRWSIGHEFLIGARVLRHLSPTRFNYQSDSLSLFWTEGGVLQSVSKRFIFVISFSFSWANYSRILKLSYLCHNGEHPFTHQKSVIPALFAVENSSINLKSVSKNPWSKPVRRSKTRCQNRWPARNSFEPRAPITYPKTLLF